MKTDARPPPREDPFVTKVNRLLAIWTLSAAAVLGAGGLALHYSWSGSLAEHDAKSIANRFASDKQSDPQDPGIAEDRIRGIVRDELKDVRDELKDVATKEDLLMKAIGKQTLKAPAPGR
jgi:hypothetical protein